MIIAFGILFAVAAYVIIMEGRPKTYCYYCLEEMRYDNKNRRWTHPNNGCEAHTPVGIIQ